MKRALIALSLAALVGCKIPSLKPFSDATADMVTALRQGFERTRTTLAAAAESANTTAFAKDVARLDQAWKPTNEALSALVAYSDSLAALAEAGGKGKETMAKFTGAVNDLATAVGALPLQQGVVSVVNLVGAKIIEMEAARDIRKAVLNASQAVDIMAPVLGANIAGLRNIHATASRAWEANAGGTTSVLRDYQLSLLDEEQRLQKVLTLIVNYQGAPAKLRHRAVANDKEKAKALATLNDDIKTVRTDLLKTLGELDPTFASLDQGTTETSHTVEARQRQLMELVTAHRKEIELLDPKFQQANTELARIHESRVTGDRILDKGAQAIAAWQKSHRSLQATVDGQQSRPSVSDLLSITKEIAALLQ
jgi:hypothetical protein